MNKSNDTGSDLSWIFVNVNMNGDLVDNIG
jgi:hypothetical protein